jgi:hypothetical protein
MIAAFTPVDSTIAASVCTVLVAVLGFFGARKLNVITVNTNHRMDEMQAKIDKLQTDKEDVAATRLAEAKAAPPVAPVPPLEP